MHSQSFLDTFLYYWHAIYPLPYHKIKTHLFSIPEKQPHIFQQEDDEDYLYLIDLYGAVKFSETEKMLSLYQEWYHEILKLGSTIYPIDSIPHMNWKMQFGEGKWHFVEMAKQAFDPLHLFSPGQKLFVQTGTNKH